MRRSAIILCAWLWAGSLSPSAGDHCSAADEPKRAGAAAASDAGAAKNAPRGAQDAAPGQVAQRRTSRGLGVTPPEQFATLPGFEVELVYEVPRQTHGSWVSLTVDPQGRLIACAQEGGLYRIDVSSEVPKVEQLSIDIAGAQGLLCAFGSLYVNLNTKTHPSGIWRLTDTDGDDQYDKKEHLVAFNAAGEHGPHALVLSPDGSRIMLCAGNNTTLPQQIDRSRVPRVWDEDHLLGRMPDARGHNADRLAPGGFVASINPDGSDFELIATGFRNAYDIAFNRDGELFAFDADMEWDVGTPWYRPTRVNHVISGAEFGWRNGTGKWPAYYPDSFGAAIDIGPGSPTGISFGYGSQFPERYQNALFLGDWSYGNIYAAHLTPDGSSYTGTYETFATAAPLAVTDMAVRPEDGMLYFTIGGRSTQSGLYRIRYRGTGASDAAPAVAPKVDPAVAAKAAKLRNLRQQLEAFHLAEPSEVAVEMALEHLDHADAAISFAARIALEHQPLASWKSAIESLESASAKTLAVIALARHGEAGDRDLAMRVLNSISWSDRTPQERLNLLRAYALTSLRLGAPSKEEAAELANQLIDQFPADDSRVNRELAQWLVYLNAPQATGKVVAMLESSPSQEDQIHYAMTLRGATNGWTPELRRAYLEWFNAMQTARGGMSFGGFIENIKSDHVQRLPKQTQEELADVINPPKRTEAEAIAPPRPFVKQWTVEELVPIVSDPKRTPDFERGKEMFAAAQCYKCHRLGIQGGILGPDLTGAGGRFNARDLLVSIIEPNQVISDQYGATQFLTDDGRVVVGRVVNLAGKDLRVMTNMLDPSALVDVDRESIESTSPAPNSMMPSGLLDTLSQEEIADLVAYLRAGGVASHPLYLTATASAESPPSNQATESEDSQPWISFEGGNGPGAGKHVVLVSGDEEYRSEEALPQLAKILSTHLGFTTTVLFPIDPASGEIDPENVTNIPGLEKLRDADLMVMALRFRNLPDEQMKHLVEYVESGRPIIGLRTATHAFNPSKGSMYEKYGWTYGKDPEHDKEYEGGFGRRVLGETWIAHHGKHKSEATRGVVVDPDHPIVQGIESGDIFGPSDVYRVRLPLPGDSHVIVRGQILQGMKPTDPPVVDERNDPMMPIAWTRSYQGGRVFTTTMGAATDLASEGVRRMIVNAALWCVGREDKITPDLKVDVVGEFDPSPYGFGGYVKGKKPQDYR